MNMASSSVHCKFLEAFASAHISDGLMENNGDRMLDYLMDLQGTTPLLAEVKELKNKGNCLFKQNYFDSAAECYDEACKLLSLSLGNIGGEDIQSLSDLAVSLMSNMAACALKLEEYRTASGLCSMILGSFPHNVKALFRRAVAYMKLKRFSKAEVDLVQALMVEPSNKDVLRELEVVKGHLLIKENGKRMLEAATEDCVDESKKKSVHVSASDVDIKDSESMVTEGMEKQSDVSIKDDESVSIEVTNERSNCGAVSDINEKGNWRVNMEMPNDVRVCGVGVGTSLKNKHKQVSCNSTMEFSKKGGGNSRIRIPGQAYQKLLEGKELSFYQKRNMSIIAIRVLNVETTNKGTATKESCKKIKKKRRSPRRRNSKTVIDETPPPAINNVKPLATSSRASSLGDNFTSSDTQISHVPFSNPSNDSNLASSPVTNNATFICPNPQFGSNDHQPSLSSTSPVKGESSNTAKSRVIGWWRS